MSGNSDDTAPQKSRDAFSGPPPGMILWREDQLRRAIEAAGVALWPWNVDSDKLTMDARAFELWGLEESDHVCFEETSSSQIATAFADITKQITNVRVSK